MSSHWPRLFCTMVVFIRAALRMVSNGMKALPERQLAEISTSLPTPRMDSSTVALRELRSSRPRVFSSLRLTTSRGSRLQKFCSFAAFSVSALRL